MIPYNRLNNEQRGVIEEILSGEIEEDCVFLTGLAGTGKSEVLLNLRIKMEEMKIPYIVLATTGTAAGQVGGVTIHYGLGLTPSKISKGIYKGKPIPAFLSAKYIFIDESSMLDKSVFNALRANMLQGQKLILTGDLNQLPVVYKGAKRRTYEELLKSMLFYIVGEPMKVYILTEVVRQKEDRAFVELLNRLPFEGYFDGLNDSLSKADYIDEENEERDLRVIAAKLVHMAGDLKEFAYIAATRSKCDQMNRFCLEILAETEGISSRVYSVEEIYRPSLEKLSPENREIIKGKLAEMHEETEQIFYMTEKVIVTANKINPITQKMEYANGSIGFITALADDHVEVSVWDKATDIFIIN